MVAISKIAVIVAGLFASSAHGLGRLRARDLSNVTIPLSPAQQTALGLPHNPLSAVGVGFGVQNYTCSTNNVFVSTGAFADLIDVSPLASNQSFVSTIHEDAFKIWTNTNQSIQEVINTDPASTLAQLYYVRDDAGLVPVWDFRATANFTGVETATIMGFGSGSIPDVDPANIPWVYYTRLTGAIADEVYQIHTVSGVAPSSCVSGSTKDISVKYVAQYWFYGGSLGLGSNSSSPSNPSDPSTRRSSQRSRRL